MTTENLGESIILRTVKTEQIQIGFSVCFV